MKNIIQELYAGNITPCDRRPTKEFKTLNELYSTEYENFRKLLSDEQKPAFDRMMDAYTTLLCCDGRELFQTGFCLGAQIMLEALYPPASS